MRSISSFSSRCQPSARRPTPSTEVIAIVSSAARERGAFAGLCDLKGWTSIECDSMRALRHMAVRVAPKVALVRYQLADGYSDDVIGLLTTLDAKPAPKVIVLLPPHIPSAIEVRQLEIGADCVLRDPVRADLLIAYLAKYLRDSVNAPAPPRSASIPFAGAQLNPLERTLRLDDQAVTLTPREVTLVELLVDAAGRVVTYDSLYSHILGRRFRGDTSNMRVLLGRLGSTIKPLGIQLRDHVDVIAKTGYRCRITTDSPRRIPPASKRSR